MLLERVPPGLLLFHSMATVLALGGLGIAGGFILVLLVAGAIGPVWLLPVVGGGVLYTWPATWPVLARQRQRGPDGT